MLVKRNFSRK